LEKINKKNTHKKRRITVKKLISSYQPRILDFSLKIAYFTLFTIRDVSEYNSQIEREKLRLLGIFWNVHNRY